MSKQDSQASSDAGNGCQQDGIDMATDRDDRPSNFYSGLTSSQSEPRLGSRILVTWLELTIVGITGGVLGATIGGPPGFIIYLTTTLLTVAILLYNVNKMIEKWLIHIT